MHSLTKKSAAKMQTSSTATDDTAHVLRRVWFRMKTRRKRQMGLLLVLLIIGMAFEAITVAAVIPVVTVLAQPTEAMDMTVLQPVIWLFSIENASDLRAPVAALFFTFIITSAGVRLLYLWASMRLTAGIGADFAAMAFRQTLHLPYAQQTQFRSNYFVTSVQKIEMITSRGLMPLLTAFGALVTALTIAATLFIVEPLITIALALTIIIVLLMLVVLFRGPLRRLGRQQAALQPVFMGKLQTARGGIREIILDDAQEFFARDLSRTQWTLRGYNIQMGLLTSAPRFFIEAIFIIVLVSMAYVIFAHAEDVASGLPTMSLIAIGALKILPATQTIAVHWATLRGALPNMADALELFDGDVPETSTAPIRDLLDFQDSIKLKNVWFRYAEDQPWILQGINLEIRKGERIGVIGSTGSGKSTLIDILMGLLSTSRGEIFVDGVLLDDTTRRAWRKRIAHVPQSIYLTDASVAENIGFGMPRDQINSSKVVSAAHKADIVAFVEDGASGFETDVGERGNQISGGQRQRIGIARALYKNAEIIVLDEATSALDGKTEGRIMQTILELGRKTTIIMIAHRLTTLKDCDRIVELDSGRIKRLCHYKDLEHSIS